MRSLFEDFFCLFVPVLLSFFFICTSALTTKDFYPGLPPDVMNAVSIEKTEPDTSQIKTEPDSGQFMLIQVPKP